VTRPFDPLDALFSEESGLLPSALFRGYISHALLFYRQNNLRGFAELLRLGRELPLGRGGETGRRQASPPVGKGWDEALAAVRQDGEKKAGRLLDAAIRKAPGEPAFRILRGFVRGEPYWGSRRLSLESIADFETALALDPDQLWARVGLGMALEMRRRYVRAIAQFEAASRLAPRWAWPRVFAGVCRWYLADPRGSTRLFAEAARRAPDCGLPLLFMARAKADYRDTSLVKDLDKALCLSPKSGFALSWRGRAMFVLKRTPEALADLRRSIDALPDYDRGWSWLGVSLAEKGDHAEALPLLREAAALNPYYPTTLYPFAGALMKAGRWAEAGRVLREAASVDRSGVWIEHRISMSHPNPAALRSRRDLDVYLGKRSNSAWAWAWRGQTELLLQNYGGALADLERALALEPKNVWALVWRGETRRRLGAFAAALADFDSALALDERLTWARAARGDCLIALGRPRQALAALDRSLRAQDRCAPAHAFRGRALLALGRARDAAAAFENGLELHPQDRWVMRLRALSLALAGDWTPALAALPPGALSDDDEALRAYALARSGRAAEGRAAAAGALRLNPAHPLARALAAGRVPALAEAVAALSAGDPAAAFSTEVLARAARAAGLRAGARALERGDARAALAACGEVPRDSSLYRLRGWLRLSCGDAAGAVEDASRALDASLDPTDRAALWLRARAGRPDVA
jgi:tetratricopeptide (TPR) repeat protein